MTCEEEETLAAGFKENGRPVERGMHYGFTISRKYP